MICSFYVVVVAAAVAVAVAALSGGARVVVVPLVKKLVYKIFFARTIVPGCTAWDLELARLIEFLIILGSLYLNPKPSSPRPKAPKPKVRE